VVLTEHAVPRRASAGGSTCRHLASRVCGLAWRMRGGGQAAFASSRQQHREPLCRWLLDVSASWLSVSARLPWLSFCTLHYGIALVQQQHTIGTYHTHVPLVPLFGTDPQTRTTTETVLRAAMQGAGAGARAGPHAGEDCGGDPRCRPRCRGGNVVCCDVFYADNAHEFPRCTLACLCFCQIGIRVRVHTNTTSSQKRLEIQQALCQVHNGETRDQRTPCTVPW
jgi:hypothetical protein